MERDRQKGRRLLNSKTGGETNGEMDRQMFVNLSCESVFSCFVADQFVAVGE